MTGDDEQLELDFTARVPDGAYEGVDAAEEGAEAHWWTWAWRELEQLARTGRPFTADDLRATGLDDPDSPARWGALFVAARKAKLIRPTRTVRPSTTASRHGAIVREWIGDEPCPSTP